VQITEPATQVAFKELSKEITLKNALTRASANISKTQAITFGDLLGGVLGTFGGSVTGGPLGAIAGFGVGIGLRKTVQSPLTITIVAQTLNKIGLAGNKIAPILEKLAPAERTLILNALKKATNAF
jgi:hypothetical protein